MNSKGQTFGLAIIFAIVIFLFGILFINFLMPDVTTARTAMDCANPAISDGSKLTCLLIDAVVPYWILLVLSAGGGLLAAKFLI